MKKLVLTEFCVLLAGTIFAWTNFGVELANWINKQACTTGCAVGLVNPFYTPCFYGALVFTLAWIISLIMLLKVQDKRK